MVYTYLQLGQLDSMSCSLVSVLWTWPPVVAKRGCCVPLKKPLKPPTPPAVVATDARSQVTERVRNRPRRAACRLDRNKCRIDGIAVYCEQRGRQGKGTQLTSPCLYPGVPSKEDRHMATHRIASRSRSGPPATQSRQRRGARPAGESAGGARGRTWSGERRSFDHPLEQSVRPVMGCEWSILELLLTCPQLARCAGGGRAPGPWSATLRRHSLGLGCCCAWLLNSRIETWSEFGFWVGRRRRRGRVGIEYISTLHCYLAV